MTRIPPLAAIVLGVVLGLAVATPAPAQNEPLARTPKPPSTGGSQAEPSGSALTRPADPSARPQGPTQPQTMNPSESEAATNAITNVGPGSLGEGAERTVRQQPPNLPHGANAPTDQKPELRDPRPPSQVLGTTGGASPPKGQVNIQDLDGMTVRLQNGKEFGEVAGVLADVNSGRLETLMISAGGLLQMGDQVYDVPWSQIASIDSQRKVVQLKTNEADITRETVPEQRQEQRSGQSQ